MYKKEFEKKITQKITLDIQKLDNDFEGVSYIANKRYIVKGALPNETVEASELKTVENITLCKLEKVITASPERVTPSCPFYENCGNCNMLHMNYNAQLLAKTNYVRRKLVANKLLCEVQPCHPSETVGSRNKVHLVFSNENNELKIGFFNEKSHQVIDVDYCAMHSEWYSLLATTLREWVIQNNIVIYDPRNGLGLLRFAVARVIDKSLQLTLVVTDKLDVMPLYDMLIQKFAVVSFYINVNGNKTNEVLAGKFLHLAGPRIIEGEIMGIKFSLSPNSFFQVNTKIATEIYEQVLDIVNKSECTHVVDLYSGIGITSMLFAKSGRQVISMEIVEDAVKDARKLAIKNDLQKNINIMQGDCTDILSSIEIPASAAFFVDPPRCGLGEKVCGTICKFAPKTIIYLSCNPDTLLKDISILTANGYKLDTAIPYDMFVSSKHVETLITLKRSVNN